MADSPYSIGITIKRLAHSYGSADDLLEAVRKAHPTAKKKDIVLAALAVMIDQSETDEVTSRKLHGMAFDHRGADN